MKLGSECASDNEMGLTTDDYENMADQRRSDIYVVFTKILCGRNFCVWLVTKLKFTGQLQMASRGLYLQFETNLMSNRKDIELPYN